MLRIRLIFTTILIVLLAACGQEEPPSYRHYVGVKKILVHEVGQYSVVVPSGHGGYILEPLQWCTATFYEDVSLDEEMWAEETREMDLKGTKHTRCTFHIHSLKEINGAGWNHGKFGSGQTTVIE